MRNETIRVCVYRVFGTILMAKACTRPLQAQPRTLTSRVLPPFVRACAHRHTQARAMWTGILHYAVYATPKAIRPTRPDVCKTYFHRRRVQKKRLTKEKLT